MSEIIAFVVGIIIGAVFHAFIAKKAYEVKDKIEAKIK